MRRTAITIVEGDALDVLAQLEPESFDACVTDPPYGIGFMGRKWDTFSTRDLYRYQRWTAEWARLVFRVLKPGGFVASFSGTRTYHRMACGLEDAGLEVRDFVDWIYGTGFPKSIDGEREVARALCRAPGRHFLRRVPPTARRRPDDHVCEATDTSRAFAAVGSALKPAHEAIALARKPFQGRVGDSLLATGLGGLQVEAARVLGAAAWSKTDGATGAGFNVDKFQGAAGAGASTRPAGGTRRSAAPGRWPPNVVLSHLEDCQPLGRVRVPGRSGSVTGQEPSAATAHVYNGRQRGAFEAYGTESVEAWLCVEGCAVALLNEQSGQTVTPATVGRGGSSRRITLNGLNPPGDVVDVPSHGDAGGGARFFPVFRYEAKPFRDERDLGCEDLEARTGGKATHRTDGDAGLKSPRAGSGRTGGARNYHPTVKPLGLVRWLVRLVTPPGGRVVEPFAGSGTTAMACKVEGVDCYAIEREADYVQIARRRVKAVTQAAILALAEDLEPEPEAPAPEQGSML